MSVTWCCCRVVRSTSVVDLDGVKSFNEENQVCSPIGLNLLILSSQ